MRSLVVDDDFTCGYIYQTALSKLGQCDVLNNGYDAIYAYQSSLDKGTPYSLIIIDIMMPDINGYEVLKRIRDIERERNITFPFNVKIILATGLDDVENRKIAETLDEFSEAYMVKSSNINELIEKLNMFGFDTSEYTY